MTHTAVCAWVTAAFFIAVASTSSAGELQWQRGRTSNMASSRPTNSQRHRDSKVRPAAFEDEGAGPRLTSADEGRARFRSLVVNHGEGSDVRSAQRPGYTDQPGMPSTDNLEEKITIPFGEPPEATPPAETPDTELTPEPPALPETNDNLAPPATRQRRPGEPAPPTFRSLPPPERGTPERTPIDSSLQQEIVPDVTRQTPEPGTNEESCDESWSKLKAKTIGTVDLSIQVTGKEGEDFPYECAIQESGLIGRCWAQTTYLWKASALCHKPLYFEDEQLERYGHSMPPCIQPFCSGAHFFCTMPVLPYCMGVEPPTECIYALGHYRPGSCAPYMFEPVPLSWRGALFEAGAWTGAAFVIP
jgi:hypothetical protein